ncbi:DUF1272 domain-containing protein [Paraglaciecola sp. 2405UD69-4]|uniref:DUF1272 domain-containing protein n=1 Tax=Paraglaciecola sp. 2405UD69-4 TaxID=3391836 RepID=UPI0039C94915
MLKLKPNCETCDCDLPPQSIAYICSFECTYCETCSDKLHQYTCPSCKGNLEKRPIRPTKALLKYPASTKKLP